MTYNILNGHLCVNEANFWQEHAHGWLPQGTLAVCSNLPSENLDKI